MMPFYNLIKFKYTLFLFSFLIMLFGDLFIAKKWFSIFQTLLIIQNMIISLVLFQESKKIIRNTAYSIVFLGVVATIISQQFPEMNNYFFVGVYLLYFLIVSYQLFYDLLFKKELGIEIISAAFCGFILIGTVASIIFVSMHSSGAFSSPTGEITYSDYMYFSFVTLLTIGYGDIVPITPMAKKAIILIGLIGHFYTVFVVSIIVGKFTRNK